SRNQDLAHVRHGVEGARGMVRAHPGDGRGLCRLAAWRGYCAAEPTAPGIDLDVYRGLCCGRRGRSVRSVSQQGRADSMKGGRDRAGGGERETATGGRRDVAASSQQNGAGAGAMLAAAIGVFVIGLMTTLASASPGFANSLSWITSVGPLSGKTGVGVIVWLLSWIYLHVRYRDVDVNLDRTLRWTGILILLGWLGTFPLFYEM